MIFVELPTEEILKKTQELREQAMRLAREAEGLWIMCKATIKQTDENAADQKADGNGEDQMSILCCFKSWVSSE